MSLSVEQRRYRLKSKTSQNTISNGLYKTVSVFNKQATFNLTTIQITNTFLTSYILALKLLWTEYFMRSWSIHVLQSCGLLTSQRYIHKNCPPHQTSSLSTATEIALLVINLSLRNIEFAWAKIFGENIIKINANR